MAALALSGACSDDGVGNELPKLYDLEQAPKAIQLAAAAVVRIHTAGRAYGTGSFISASGLLMTNNHVLGVEVCPLEGCWVELSFDHQRGLPYSSPLPVFVMPQHVDVGLDLAVVQVYEQANDGTASQTMLETPDFLSLRALEPTDLIGKHITIVGHPQGRLKKWAAGQVVDTDGEWFQSTTFILPGDSGSPVLDDKGMVVGLIHRGETGPDLLTSLGDNRLSIGSASAPLLRAMDAALPDVMLSIADDVSPADAVANNTLYLSAGANNAMVAGAPVGVLSLLAEACDAGLARTDIRSPEELTAALGPCSDAMGWIECRNASTTPSSGGAFTSVCPTADERDAWAQRFQAMNTRQQALTGALNLSAVSFGIAALQSTPADGASAAAESLGAVLSAAQPPCDFTLASYLASFGFVNCGNTTVLKLITGFDKVPHYALYGSEIASAAIGLNNSRQLASDKTFDILSRLAADPRVSIGTKLYIEDVQYRAGKL